ncbi:MFS transporter [Moraxella pluranimalium]|uniref:MFS transporter n=1 Tax=Moraxella pluranimalium TaxID=470453 RepID=A0A1T0CTU2_9GAMM|nr:MFS transporter [Moraxella pluranimalium]OOS25778.1 MFS transporter [Moraxella pluranimalium]
MTKSTAVWSLVAIAATILLITTGIRLSLGLFIQPITSDTSVNIVQISFALAVTQLMWGVSQPITGAIADRFGAWWVLLLGTIMLAVGCALVPHLLSAWGLTLTLGVLIAFGSGAGSFSVLMGQVANQVPEQARGTASGIINAGSSFGQFLFAPMLQLLISLPLVGWSKAFYVLAGISLLCLPLAWYLTRGFAQSLGSTAPTTNQPQQSLSSAIKSAMSDRNYLLIHLAFFTCGFHIAFLVTHLPTEVTLAGLSSSVASWSLALIGLSNVAGSLFVGWSVGRWRCKYILFWMYLSRVILVAIYLMSPQTPMTFYIFAIGLGLTWLATVPPTAGAIGKLFGVRYLATLFGLTLLSHQIGGFLGAYFGGLAIDSFGNYAYMWYADMALAFLAAVSNLPIKEPKVVRTAQA